MWAESKAQPYYFLSLQVSITLKCESFHFCALCKWYIELFNERCAEPFHELDEEFVVKLIEPVMSSTIHTIFKVWEMMPMLKILN